MNTRIIIPIIAIVISSCGGGNQQAELDALKKKQARIAEKIRLLEAEIDSTSSTGSFQVTGRLVGITTMQPEPFNHFIEVQGKLDGDQNIAVNPKTMGFVESILVKEGDVVTKGQILAKLDDAVLEQSVKELESSLAFALEMYEKQERLWEQKIGSEVQYLQAKNTKESLENRMATLRDQLDMSRIKSPINGTVEEVITRVGASVAPGMPAFRVVNFSSLKVVAEVAEAYNPRVSKGDKVLIYLPDIREEISGTITFTSRFINPINRTFQVEARVVADPAKLKANMIAVLKIKDYANPAALVLPISVVQTGSSGSYVHVVEKNGDQEITTRRVITMGEIYNGLVEITTGLKEGDRVITIGFQDLDENEPVRVALN